MTDPGIIIFDMQLLLNPRNVLMEINSVRKLGVDVAVTYQHYGLTKSVE